MTRVLSLYSLTNLCQIGQCCIAKSAQVTSASGWSISLHLHLYIRTEAVIAADYATGAAGECGLDFNRNFSPPDVQEKWFEAQVKLALQLQKPLFMHCRDAGARFAGILSQAGIVSSSGSSNGSSNCSSSVPGVLHCFTGNEEELRQILDLGLCVGITGQLNTRWLRTAAAC